MPTSTMTPSRPFKVVVVEDSRTDAQMIVEGLQREGRNLDILLVRDGEQASLQLGQGVGLALEPLGRPDLILLDLHLPKKGGAELLLEIKKVPTLSDVPVVVFSGSTSPAEVWGCYDRGANLVVQKPLEAEYFVNIVGAISRYCLEQIGLPDSGWSGPPPSRKG